MKIDFNFANRTTFLNQLFDSFHELESALFLPQLQIVLAFSSTQQLPLKDAATCEQQHIQSFSNARAQSYISSKERSSICHMLRKRSSCIAFTLVVENAQIHLKRKKPESKARKKNKCTTTVQLFQEKLCNYCHCISKYCHICKQIEHKVTK